MVSITNDTTAQNNQQPQQQQQMGNMSQAFNQPLGGGQQTINNQQQPQQTMGGQQQQQTMGGQPQMGGQVNYGMDNPNATTNTSPLTMSGDINDAIAALTGSNIGAFIEGSMGATASTVMKQITEFMKENSTECSKWSYDVVSHGELPSGQCILIYTKVDKTFYVHPILFGEKGGRATQANVISSGMNQLVTVRVSDASICASPAFKNMLLPTFQRQDNGAEAANVTLCGATIYYAGQEILPGNLIGNAGQEIITRICMDYNRTDLRIVKFAALSGSEVIVDTVSDANKMDIHGRPIFAPIVLSTMVRRHSSLGLGNNVGDNTNSFNGGSNNNLYSTPLGEVSGYIDMQATSMNMRNNIAQQISASNNYNAVVPLYAPYFNITGMQWGRVTQTGPTPENLLMQILSLPVLPVDGVWVNRVVNAEQAGFNPRYDFSTIGYDECKDFTQVREPFTDCKSINAFSPQQQTDFANKVCTGLRIRIDLSIAGPYAGMLMDLTDAKILNQAIFNLTGLQSNYQGIGHSMGLIPMGTYDHMGKKRDIREIMNYFSWGKFVLGNLDRMAEYERVWMCAPQNPEHGQQLYRQRLEMCKEVSNDTFELSDQALRLDFNNDICNDLRNVAQQQGINFVSTKNRNNYGSSNYGFNGEVGGGIQSANQNGGNQGQGQWVNGNTVQQGMGY